MKPNLALFDFDGTLTRKDTLFEFISYARGRTSFYWIMIGLLPWLAMLRIRMISAQRVKERLLRKAVGGLRAEMFNHLCMEFCRDRLPSLFRKAAFDRLEMHLKQGDTIFVVSASPENWIIPWAETKHVGVISTKLRLNEGKITGDILGLNCNGPEKVNRVKQQINLAEFDKIYAYGDSSGDKELLRLADFPFYRKFN